MKSVFSLVALTLLLYVVSTTVGYGSNTVIDGTISTGTFGGGPTSYFEYWETQGANWPRWMLKNYDTSENGEEDPCFHFRPSLSVDCTLVQPIYLIHGRTYEFRMDAAFYNT